MNYQDDINDLFEKHFGVKTEDIFALPPSASNRRYLRLISGENSAIGAYNPDLAENDAFVYISERLKKAGVNVPQIYRFNRKKHVYLLQDLGDIKLLDLVEEYRKNKDPDYIHWYRKVIDQMPAIQYKTAEHFNFSNCFPRHAFDRQSILWDLNYFKYYFLKLAYIPFHEQKLEDDFQRLTDFLLEAPSEFFMFRDFQSRNIMISNNEVYFIDYQGGRQGALQYDLASLLFEAKVTLSVSEREILLNHYLEVFSSYTFFDKNIFLRYFPAFAIIRLLQAFGAYGYRGYFERKSFFLQSIPPALENLKWLITKTDLQVKIPYLSDVLKSMIDSFSSKIPDYKDGMLTVSVNSFSYKKSVPEDFSGNGGGFVFDCRALPNPGRYEEFMSKTGRDNEVIQYLSEKVEVSQFIDNAKKIISASIENYLERGFEHLQVSFGCTGGQHRSVYCADRINKWIQQNYRVNLHLNHYELGDREHDKNHL